MTADASHLAKPQICQWTRQRTFPFCINVLRSWAPISLSRIPSWRNVSCTQHTTVARPDIYLHRLRMWWQKQVEIPVAGKQDTTQRLATFQTSDFHFNLAPEKWQCRSDTGKIADTMTTNSEELNTGSVWYSALAAWTPRQFPSKTGKWLSHDTVQEIACGFLCSVSRLLNNGKEFYSCEMWCSHSGTDEVRGLLVG